jgi:hypothetical protein
MTSNSRPRYPRFARLVCRWPIVLAGALMLQIGTATLAVASTHATSGPGLAMLQPFGSPDQAARDAGAGMRGWAYELATSGAPWEPTPFVASGRTLFWSRAHFGLETALNVSASRFERAQEGTDTDLALRLHVRSNDRGAWFGVWRAIDRPTTASIVPVHAEAGAWWRRGPVSLNLALEQAVRVAPSVQVTATTDSLRPVIVTPIFEGRGRAATTSRLEMAWGRGAWTVGVAGTTRMTPGLATNRWLRAKAGVRIAPEIWLVAAAGSEASDALGARAAAKGPSLTLVMNGIRSRPKQERPSFEPRLEAHVGARNRVRFEWRQRGAHSVELSGDFSGWEPRPLECIGAEAWRLDAEIWRLDAVLEPGIHHLLIRIDGGPWAPPAGLPGTSDALYGTVGVLTIE